MKKLLFVDHDYHKKTKSSDFFRKILKKNFLLQDYWVDKKLKLDKKIYEYENIFFWQIFPPLKILRKLKNKNITWAPMYDSPMYPTGYSWLLWIIVKFPVISTSSHAPVIFPIFGIVIVPLPENLLSTHDPS